MAFPWGGRLTGKEVVEGVLGRALWRYPEIRLVAYFFLSNHYTILLVTPDEQTLSAFMGI